MKQDRRGGLTPAASDRERKLRHAIRALEELFPGQGIGLFVFEWGGPNAEMGWISNAKREDTRKMLREYLERSEVGTDDTLGRGEG